jgi:hypothetical protein
MTHPNVIAGLVGGGVLLLFGLSPGLFRDLTEGVRNLADSVSPGLYGRSPRRTECESVQRPIGLAVLGALMIALSVYAYFSA